MNKWFRKGNGRRFHRVDMPLRYYIVPSSPIKDREIYATGANYFPQPLVDMIETRKYDTIRSVEKIKEQSALITEIFNDVIADIEFLGECTKSISNGISPKNNVSYWLKINDKLKGFSSINRIEASSPKTFQYLSLIEEKYLSYLQRLTNSINESTPEHFMVEGVLPIGYKLDEMMSVFEQEKFAKIPLIQAILNLSKFLEAYLDVYRQINDDNYLKQFPQEWPQQIANVSASGLAILLPKRFELYSRVDVYLYFEANDKVINFDGSVVDLRADNEKHRERIAINFEFPNGNDQNFIQQEIQKQEVKECMKFALYS
ncbi:PilZ domain-containing protein [Thiomicrorhabdus sp. Kp2]|uniref:PilZ domain-containing protein n=1 Tax=Thiomicrorhabdus sp. Kp2 TaxID=1123518 RepID=UPI00041E2FC1|nr:PilZ domain-containing protein [Thiomicrorhabdus sp. Kp2]